MAVRLLAGPHRHVENAVDGGGMDPDADFPEAWLRIGDGFIAQHIGGPEIVEDDGLHGRTPAESVMFMSLSAARPSKPKGLASVSAISKWL